MITVDTLYICQGYFPKGERTSANMEFFGIALIGLGLAFGIGFGIPELRKGFWAMRGMLENRLKDWQARGRAKKLRQLTLTFFC